MGNAADTKDVVNVLNGLIETNKDGQEGFRLAAEKVKDTSLKSLFANYSSQRAANATELQQIVTRLGEKPSTSGHIAASLHRGWMNLKEALSRDEDKAIIDECEAGEDAAIQNYRDALSKDLPTDVLSLIQKQFAGVQEAHRVVRDLKHGTQAARA